MTEIFVMALRLLLERLKLKPTLKIISALTGWDRKVVVSVRIPRIPTCSIQLPTPLMFRARPRRLIIIKGEEKTFLMIAPNEGFFPALAERMAITGMAMKD